MQTALAIAQAHWQDEIINEHSRLSPCQLLALLIWDGLGLTAIGAHIKCMLSSFASKSCPLLTPSCVHILTSSILEWRRAYPLLEAAGVEPWAMDILGWGFSESGLFEFQILPLYTCCRLCHRICWDSYILGTEFLIASLRFQGFEILGGCKEGPHVSGQTFIQKYLIRKLFLLMTTECRHSLQL